jgi:hypothetical protein
MTVKLLTLPALAAALCGCAAGAPVRVGDTRPPVPRFPQPIFVGNYPQAFRAETLRQLAQCPAPQRMSPPKFALATQAEIAAKVGRHAIGYYDVTGPTVVTLRDKKAHREYALHELAHDWFLRGADPKWPDRPKFMSQSQRAAWHLFCVTPTGRLDPKTGKPKVIKQTGQVEYGWSIIQPYSDDKREDAKRTDEKFAVAFNIALWPGGNHPRYGRLDPLALARLKEALMGP